MPHLNAICSACCFSAPKVGGPSPGTNPNHSVLVCATPEPNVCPCPEIPLVNLTETPPTDCFPINGTFRYKCKAGYVREAGTSNLIRCIQTGNVVEWSTLTLKCKRKVYLLLDCIMYANLSENCSFVPTFQT